MTNEEIKDLVSNNEEVTMYIYYDGPILWTFKKNNNLYLALELIGTKNYSKYIISPVTENEIKELENDNIQLHDFLKNSKIIYGFKQYCYNNQPTEYYEIDKISDEELPINNENYFK